MAYYKALKDGVCAISIVQAGDVLEKRDENLYINGVKTPYGFYYSRDQVTEITEQEMFEMMQEKAITICQNGQTWKCKHSGKAAIIKGPTRQGVAKHPVFAAGPNELWAYVPNAANICIFSQGTWGEKLSEAPKEQEEPVVCKDCDGTGVITTAALYPTGHTELTSTCYTCNGQGKVGKPVVGAYVRITKDGAYGGVKYVKGEVWKIEELYGENFYVSGIFVVRNDKRTQVGLSECQYFGMTKPPEVIERKSDAAKDPPKIKAGAWVVEVTPENSPEIAKFRDLPTVTHGYVYSSTVKDSGYYPWDHVLRPGYPLVTWEEFKEINKDFFINSQTKSDEHVRSNKSVQLRTKSPKIGQGEGCLEGRIQGRKSKIKLAISDSFYEGGPCYSKTKGARP